EGFAVQTSGLRRSNLVGRDIDELLAKNAVTRLTLALMYATDFFDQLEHRIVPALRSGAVVLADRFIFTLIARGVVRGINRDYMTGLYAMAQRLQRQQATPSAHCGTTRHSRFQVHSFRRSCASLALTNDMSEPVHIAAIDAGSNAVRLSVARAYSAMDIEPLLTERYSLRLGEGVFVRHRFTEDILKKGVKAFRHLREIMDELGVNKYRAVATSATREAQNRDLFIRGIKKATGISLELISAKEESRLGREAVVAALGPEAQPRCVVDLGGGSLELSILRDHSVSQAAQLPVGTVRLMTTLGIHGVIRPAQCEQVRRYVRALLESRLPDRPNLAEEVSVALGGNAETLAAIAPGPRQD